MSDKINIQYISDLHLELNKNFGEICNSLIPSSPYLALLGDISYPHNDNYTKFLDYVSNRFEHVFLLAGNHEYYQIVDFDKIKTYNEINDDIKNIVSKYKNVHFLDNSNFTLNCNGKEIIFAGTTLWSNVNNYDRSKIKNSISDYRYIYKDHRYTTFTIDDTNKLNENCVNFIKNTLDTYKDKNVIMLSHHLPSYQMIDEKYKDSYINSAFANDLDCLFDDKGPIRLWLCGHSHCSLTKTINGIVCSINAYGYPHEIKNNININEVIYFDIY
jgi:hypothetical protein